MNDPLSPIDSILLNIVHTFFFFSFEKKAFLCGRFGVNNKKAFFFHLQIQQ